MQNQKNVDEIDIDKIMDEVFEKAIAEVTPEQREALRNQPPRTFHYTELEETDPNEVLGIEFNHYVRNIGNLLQQGHEGKYVLIKGEQMFGVFDSFEDAHGEGLRRFGNQAMFIHQILENLPILRVRGLNF